MACLCWRLEKDLNDLLGDRKVKDEKEDEACETLEIDSNKKTSIMDTMWTFLRLFECFL